MRIPGCMEQPAAAQQSSWEEGVTTPIYLQFSNKTQQPIELFWLG